MFGCSARVGLASIGIPFDEITYLNSEEDVEDLFNQDKNNLEDKELSDQEEYNN